MGTVLPPDFLPVGHYFGVGLQEDCTTPLYHEVRALCRRHVRRNAFGGCGKRDACCGSSGHCSGLRRKSALWYVWEQAWRGGMKHIGSLQARCRGESKSTSNGS